LARPSECPRTPFVPKEILRTLVAHNVDFVLVGGLGGIARGSVYPSFDVDIAYARDDENLERLAGALRELNARLRGAPPDVPFLLDAETLRRGAHFTFETPYGSLDILDRPDGSPPYADLKAAAGEPVEIEDEEILVASFDHLIAMKEASDRPKDQAMAMEYRVLADQTRARETS
jgi:hypothetical protein